MMIAGARLIVTGGFPATVTVSVQAPFFTLHIAATSSRASTNCGTYPANARMVSFRTGPAID
jgi:hypothetical protein